jgi:hypothetical protein
LSSEHIPLLAQSAALPLKSPQLTQAAVPPKLSKDISTVPEAQARVVPVPVFQAEQPPALQALT